MSSTIEGLGLDGTVVRNLDYIGATPRGEDTEQRDPEEWNEYLPKITLWKTTTKALQYLGKTSAEAKRFMEQLNNTWNGCGTLTDLAREESIVELPLPTNYIPGMSPFAELNVAHTGIISALREA